jgi:hypothetical protein
MIVSRSIPVPPPEVNLANYLILNYDPLRRSDSVVLTNQSHEDSHIYAPFIQIIFVYPS